MKAKNLGQYSSRPAAELFDDPYVRKELRRQTITNYADEYTDTPAVKSIVTCSQAEYDAIATPDENTLYVII